MRLADNRESASLMASTTDTGLSGVGEETAVTAEANEPPGKDSRGGLADSTAGARPRRALR
jgi:hypothetical protein